MSPKEIQQHLALPQIPTHVVDVTVPSGTQMQVGRVSKQKQFGVEHDGGVQYELREEIAKDNFSNARKIQ